MFLIKPSFEITRIMDMDLKTIEFAGRTCYKSENSITESSAEKFARKILKLGHESVLEHSAMTVKLICDRGVSHELVRHRLCTFSQESTRYCNYKDGCTFIIPPWFTDEETPAVVMWRKVMHGVELSYQRLLDLGWSPQQARSVLPNALKTEIVVTTNFREWRHIFKLRCSKAAHPQMRELMVPLLRACKKMIPVIFDDIKSMEV